MRMQEYSADELRFAYCYHCYLHWSTSCLRPYHPLADLDLATFRDLVSEHDIHVLEFASDPTQVRVLVSLKPSESLSACASKLKGRTSLWLRKALALEQARNLLGKGYFACTAGKSTRAQIDQYLSGQGQHHSYGDRILPPIFVEQFVPSAEIESQVRAKHAFTFLQFHLVLSVMGRRGVFAVDEARVVTEAWSALQVKLRFALLNVSFLPDHVHLAVRVHPGLCPSELVRALMNSGQEVIGQRFPHVAIAAGVGRLWQPSAYIGSYGDLASPQVQKYLCDWSRRAADG